MEEGVGRQRGGTSHCLAVGTKHCMLGTIFFAFDRHTAVFKAIKANTKLQTFKVSFAGSQE